MEVDTKARGVAPAGKRSQEFKDKFFVVVFGRVGSSLLRAGFL